jgi:hypothetical protein
MVVVGAGIGIGVGAMTDGAAHGYAWAVLLVGLALLLVRPRSQPTSLVAPDGDAPASTPRERDPRPTLSGLGDRVGQILRLSQEQAENQLAEARREAAEILRAARVEADEILARAAADAGQQSGYAAPPAPEDGSAERHR